MHGSKIKMSSNSKVEMKEMLTRTVFKNKNVKYMFHLSDHPAMSLQASINPSLNS